MKRFIIIDQSLKSLHGHHYEYDISVAEAAARLGYEPIIVSHRAFPKYLHPADIWVIPAFQEAWTGDANSSWAKKILRSLKKSSEKLQKSLSAAPKFFYYYLLLTISPQEKRFVPRLKHELVAIPRALKSDTKRIANLIKPLIYIFIYLLPYRTFALLGKIVLWIFKSSIKFIGKSIFKSLLNPFTAKKNAFSENLKAVLQKIRTTSEDHIFIHTLDIEQLEQFYDFLVTCNHDNSPHYHILLRRDCNEPIVTLAKGLGLKPCLNRFYGSGLYPKIVTFYTDTDELTKQHDAQSPIRFITAPIPFRHEKLSDRSKPCNANEPLNIVYLGDARPEKGYQYLPTLVDSLWSNYIQPKKIKFTIQSNFNIPGGEDETMPEARTRLEQYPSSKVCLASKEPIAPDIYYQLLADADIVVIPYQADRYQVRSSGVLVESLAAGKPVVVPAGTWMANQVDESRAAIYQTPNELTESVLNIVKDFDAFSQSALDYKTAWRDKHSPDALVKCLTRNYQYIDTISSKETLAILYIIDADSLTNKTGSGQVARNQLEYLSRCGYRIYGIFFFYDVTLGKVDIHERSLKAKNTLKDYNLIESWFLEYKFQFSPSDLYKKLAYIVNRVQNKSSLECDLNVRSTLDIPTSLTNFLNTQKIDVVFFNYIQSYSLIKKLGLENLPIICEMVDIQSHQYAMSNNRDINDKEFDVECQLLDRCQAVIANNSKELEKVREFAHKPSYHCVPYIGRLSPPQISDLSNCINLSEVLSAGRSDMPEDLDQVYRLNQEQSIDLLYVSSDHIPNVYSLRWFYRKVYLPYLADKGVNFVIAGNIMSYRKDLQAEIRHPKVFIAGQQETLKPLYAATRLVVLPIKMGAGFNIKTIEALSMGKPVIATRMAVRGINFDDHAFSVFDEPQAYAAQIIELLNSSQARLKQAKQGFDIVQNYYNQAKFDQVMNNVFIDVLGNNALFPSLIDIPTWSPQLVEWSPKIQVINRAIREFMILGDIDTEDCRLLQGYLNAGDWIIIQELYQAFTVNCFSKIVLDSSTTHCKTQAVTFQDFINKINN